MRGEAGVEGRLAMVGAMGQSSHQAADANQPTMTPCARIPRLRNSPVAARRERSNGPNVRTKV